MTAQKGFVYEENVVKFLAPLGFCENVTAGASHDRPDLMLVSGKKKAGCELKIGAASAGSLVLKYENNKWQFNDTSDDPEKDFLAAVAKEVKLFDLIKKKWKNKPLKRKPVDAALKAQMGKMTKKQLYEADLANFPDIKGTVPASVIENYYARKKTYYVNVGTHGFYLFGNSDPLKYNQRLQKLGMDKIPQFGQKAEATFRARVQYKGSGNYQFTFEIQFSIKSANKSPYNIGKVKGNNDVKIDVQGSDISCLA